MCGRFTLTAPGDELAEAFGLDEAPVVEPRYNIAPSQPVLAIRAHADGRRSATSLRWGLSAPAAEADEPRDETPLLINARSETAATRPAFRDAFRVRRCLIPASGFYEWKREPGRRRPYHIRRRDRRPFAFAGLWQPLEGAAGACTILTTEPNSLLAELHDRMPVILSSAALSLWLDPRPGALGALQRLLQPCPPEELLCYPVPLLVNRADREGPELVEPDPAPDRGRQGLLF